MSLPHTLDANILAFLRFLYTKSFSNTINFNSSPHVCCLWPYYKCNWLELTEVYTSRGLSRGLSGKESACQCRRLWRHRFDPWVRKIAWRRKWQPTPIFLPREFHGQMSLAGCRAWGLKESGAAEGISTHEQKVIPSFFYKAPLNLLSQLILPVFNLLDQEVPTSRTYCLMIWVELCVHAC